MPSIRNMKFRIHRVASLMLVGFFVLLTSGLLLTAYSKFEQLAEESARAIVGQLVRSNAEEFAASVDSVRRIVDVQASIGYWASIPAGTAEQVAYERRFSAELRERPDLLAYFVALQNGDFFQVIAVRGNATLIKSLSAPEWTQTAIRFVRDPGADSAKTHAAQGAKDSKREEYWRFFDANQQLLGERRAASSFDPRQSYWYQASMAETGAVMTEPQTLMPTGALGLTMARKFNGGQGVVGIDVSLVPISKRLAEMASTAYTVSALVDPKGRLLAVGGGEKADLGGDLKPLAALAGSGNPKLVLFAGAGLSGAAVKVVRMAGEPFVFAATVVAPVHGANYRMLAYAPVSDYGGIIAAARNQMLGIALALLLVTLPIVVLGSMRVTGALQELASDAERISLMDFSSTPEVRSAFIELDSLGRSQTVMKASLAQSTESLRETHNKLENLIKIGLDLGRERDRMALLKTLMVSGTALTNSDGGTLYLMTERKTLEFALRTRSDDLPSFEIPLYKPDTGEPNDSYVATHVALRNEIVVIDDIYAETRFDVSGTRKFDAESGHRTVSMLTLPLSPRTGEVIGVIQFMNAQDPLTGQIIPFSADAIRFVTALTAQAAVALDNHQLVQAQQNLMDSLIKLIAGAVDAKSPYTGGHCERVPALAIMLAEEVERQRSGPFGDFHWANDDERREFRIGAWLHDCGKVTTPEYVVDKATKLETNYDRIHEVRMRFEVLLRDARIDCLQACLDGRDAAAARAELQARGAQLSDDFSFIAMCNEGGEFMAPERIERLRRIAQQTWQRNFDDRIGISRAALRRFSGVPATPLPSTELLLSDKPEHVIPRGIEKSQDPRYGFKVPVPKNLYNLGEIYNLSIGRGTLTDEERYKINEHIIQTIMMLDALPFPKNMRRVPEYAGTHHETLLGTGYPRKLDASQLSVPSRIMAIADIFEALTASDRPYKETKTLSESIRILSFFKKDRHIDPDLFDLFLTSGVYKSYAAQYLMPEQIDEVDITQYLS